MTAQSENGVKKGALEQILLAALIAAFLMTSMLYSFAVPIFESQDEELHFALISHFATKMRLPDFRRTEDLQSAGAESNQTPLYYVVQGAWLRFSGHGNIAFDFDQNPFRSAGIPGLYWHNDPGERFPYEGKYRVIHLLRFTNIVAGVFILLIIYKTLRLMPFQNKYLPVVAAAFVVLIPQFTYVCGTLNNDVFSVLFASLTLFLLIKFVLDPNASGKYAALMSLSLSAAVMSKQMALFLIPVCYVAVLIRGDNRKRMANTLTITIVLLSLMGWYYARNWLLFRDIFTVRTQMENLAPSLVQKKTLAQFYYYFSDYFIRIFSNSFWGSFGYMTLRMHSNVYLFYNIAAAAGLASCMFGIMDPHFRSRFSGEQKIGLVLLVVAAVFLLAEVISLNFTFSQPQGRYGFTGLCILAISWGLGMDRMIPGKETHKNVLSFGLVLLFAFVNLHVVNTTLRNGFPSMPSVIDVVQNQYQAPLGEIRRDTVVGQSFRCNIDNLDQVAIRFTTFGRYNNCHVTFHLRDDSDMARDLVTIRLPAILLRNDTFHFFKFPPQRDSKDRRYLFLIESRDGAEGDAVSCLHTMFDSYDGGRAFVNGSPLPGDITFITGST